jgi:RimJ/RimL family protein N-acetyltransferase
MIGHICLSDEQDNNRGFWLVPEWRRKGYMTEACRIVTDFWFNSLNREVLRAPKASGNDASKKISLNDGMRLIQTGKKQYIEGELDSELWEITREEWNRQSRG